MPLQSIKEIIADVVINPGGTTFTNYVTMHVREFSEKGTLFGVRLRSEQIRDKGIFLAVMWNKGAFLLTLVILWNYLGIFLKKTYPCSSYSKLFMIPFRDKGINLLLILLI